MIIIKKVNALIIKIYLSIILFILISFLYQKNYIDESLFKSNIDFIYIKSKTNYLLGKIKSENDHFVSSEKLNPKNITKFEHKNKLELDEKLVISALDSGVVTFINKDLITVSQDNGIDICYENLENISVNLYDYIKKDTILGNIKDKYLILTIKTKDGYLNYEDIY